MGSRVTIDGRIAWMDAARGVGIVLVVVGHVLDGLFNALILPREGIASTLYFSIYAFHMPLFFFLSGLHVRTSLARGSERFVVSRLWTVVYPYFLWSAIQGSTQVVMSSQLNNPTTVDDVLSIALRPIGHFWFLYALALCHAAAWLTSARTRLLIAAAVSGALLYPLAPGVLSPTSYYFAFYALGVVVGPAMLRADVHVDGRLLLALGTAFAGCAALCGASNGWRAVDLRMLPVSALGVAATIAACMVLSGRILRATTALGRMSLTIYVLHIMAAAGARVVMVRLGVPPDPLLYVLGASLAGIAGPVLAHVLLKRLGWLPVLGLAEPGASPKPVSAYAGLR